MQPVPAHHALYLEAQEQLGQCLDSLDKLWRDRVLAFCPKPGVHASPREMDKPEPTSNSRTVGRRGPDSVPGASTCGNTMSEHTATKK